MVALWVTKLGRHGDLPINKRRSESNTIWRKQAGQQSTPLLVRKILLQANCFLLDLVSPPQSIGNSNSRQSKETVKW